jgi:hypothetical protein
MTLSLQVITVLADTLPEHHLPWLMFLNELSAESKAKMFEDTFNEMAKLYIASVVVRQVVFLTEMEIGQQSADIDTIFAVPEATFQSMFGRRLISANLIDQIPEYREELAAHLTPERLNAAKDFIAEKANVHPDVLYPLFIEHVQHVLRGQSFEKRHLGEPRNRMMLGELSFRIEPLVKRLSALGEAVLLRVLQSMNMAELTSYFEQLFTFYAENYVEHVHTGQWGIVIDQLDSASDEAIHAAIVAQPERSFQELFGEKLVAGGLPEPQIEAFRQALAEHVTHEQALAAEQQLKEACEGQTHLLYPGFADHLRKVLRRQPLE